jgi:pilus assembly protein TadC
MTWVLVFLAGALCIAPGAAIAKLRLAELTGRRRRRVKVRPELLVLSAAILLLVFVHWIVALAAVAAWVLTRRRQARRSVDPLRLAACWDLLAACLKAGLPVHAAVHAVAGRIPGEGGKALQVTAGLLALGADAATAWRPVANVPETAPLARGARRTARSGTALAAVASTLAAEVRVGANDASEARAQRAGVLIAGPLGLCFLPAFACIGLVPVIVGLVGRLGLTP